MSAHDLIEAVSIFGAGLAAGTINTVVGSGTLITFPTLLAFGYPPLVANVSNTVGLVPGVLSGIVGLRRELAGQRVRLLFLGLASLLGGILGAFLLLALPSDAFNAIVPVLIGLALVLVVVQPWLSARVAARREPAGEAAPVTVAAGSVAAGPGTATTGDTSTGESTAAVSDTSETIETPETIETSATHSPTGKPAEVIRGGFFLWAMVFGTGVYGGYFGAAQGVLLLAFLGISFTDPMSRLNGTKNVLAALVNGVAAVIFIALSPVNWAVAGLLAAGSVIGGQVGARIGRRLSPFWLRVLIVCVGIAALLKLLL